jgi:hypothetical protein
LRKAFRIASSFKPQASGNYGARNSKTSEV